MTESGVVWDVSLKSVAQKMSQDMQGLSKRVATALAPVLNEATVWMKQNAPWQDRTGAARASLRAYADTDSDSVTVVFAYTDPAVYYSVFLEYFMQGRYAILGPSLDVFYPKMLDAVRGALKGTRMQAGRRAERFEG